MMMNTDIDVTLWTNSSYALPQTRTNLTYIAKHPLGAEAKAEFLSRMADLWDSHAQSASTQGIAT